MYINGGYNTLFGLNALREQGNAVASATQKLSSGLRINYAADDPSGLSVSTGMSAKIKGLEASLINIQNSITMIRTMEGGLAEIHDILMRVRDLAVRAGNTAVLTTADRDKLQTEADSLVEEIGRTAQSVTFNKKYVLSGGGSEPAVDKVMVRGRPSAADNFGLYIMNADGSEVQKATESTADERHAVYSDDGSKLAYVSNESGSNDIYVASADGSDPINITNSAGSNELVPKWSPDGTKIAFYGTPTGGSADIYVINADGTGLVQLTSNAVNDSEPRWSPDGTKILYQSDIGGKAEIFIMNADGTGQTNISNHAGANDRYATWSPDGSTIAYASDFSGDWEIYTANPDGSNFTNITNAAGDQTVHHWSPDGSQILYVSNSGGNSEVYIMNADGSGQTNLTNAVGNDIVLRNADPWVDNDTIGFDSNRSGQSSSYLMNKDGSDQRVTSGGLFQTSFIGLSPPSQENPQIIQVGGNNGDSETIELNIPSITAKYLEVDSISFATSTSSGAAISAVDAAIEKISSQRETLGVIENRLRHISDENSMELINTYSARSSILDADMAAESLSLTKSSILREAATASIAQSKTTPERVLEMISEL